MQILLVEDSPERIKMFANSAQRMAHDISVLHFNGEWLAEPPTLLEQMNQEDRKNFKSYVATTTAASARHQIDIWHGDSLILLDSVLGGRRLGSDLTRTLSKLIERCTHEGQTTFVYVYSQEEDLARVIARDIGDARFSAWYENRFNPDIIESYDEVILSGLMKWEQAKTQSMDIFSRLWPTETNPFYGDEDTIEHIWSQVFQPPLPSKDDIENYWNKGSDNSKKARYVRALGKYLCALMGWTWDEIPKEWFLNAGLHEALKRLIGVHSKAHLGYRKYQRREKINGRGREYDLRLGSLLVLLGAATAPNNRWLTQVKLWPVTYKEIVAPQTTLQSYELVKALVESKNGPEPVRGLFPELRTSEQRLGPGIERVELDPSKLSIYLRFSMTKSKSGDYNDSLQQRLRYESEDMGGMQTALRWVMDAISRSEQGIAQCCRISLAPEGEKTLLQFFANKVQL